MKQRKSNFLFSSFRSLLLRLLKKTEETEKKEVTSFSYLTALCKELKVTVDNFQTYIKHHQHTYITRSIIQKTIVVFPYISLNVLLRAMERVTSGFHVGDVWQRAFRKFAPILPLSGKGNVLIIRWMPQQTHHYTSRYCFSSSLLHCIHVMHAPHIFTKDIKVCIICVGFGKIMKEKEGMWWKHKTISLHSTTQSHCTFFLLQLISPQALCLNDINAAVAAAHTSQHSQSQLNIFHECVQYCFIQVTSPP